MSLDFQCYGIILYHILMCVHIQEGLHLILNSPISEDRNEHCLSYILLSFFFLNNFLDDNESKCSETEPDLQPRSLLGFPLQILSV